MASHNHQGLARDIGAGHADMGVQGVDVFVVQLGVGSGIHVGDEGFNPTPANGVSRLQALRHGKRCDETFQEAFSEFQKTTWFHDVDVVDFALVRLEDVCFQVDEILVQLRKGDHAARIERRQRLLGTH